MRVKSPEQMLDYLQTHVRIDGECRVWAGVITPQGHPKINWKRRPCQAQRLMLILMGVKVNARVWPICGQRACMNPAHLRNDTVAAHNQWMYDTGVLPRGRQRAVRVALGRDTKLGVRAVPMLRSLRAEGLTYKQIGARLGAHPSTIGHLLKRWDAL